MCQRREAREARGGFWASLHRGTLPSVVRTRGGVSPLCEGVPRTKQPTKGYELNRSSYDASKTPLATKPSAVVLSCTKAKGHCDTRADNKPQPHQRTEAMMGKASAAEKPFGSCICDQAKQSAPINPT